MRHLRKLWLAAILLTNVSLSVVQADDSGHKTWSLSEHERKVEDKANKRLNKMVAKMAKRWQKANERYARHLARISK
jgi:hypothetical protein